MITTATLVINTATIDNQLGLGEREREGGHGPSRSIAAFGGNVMQSALDRTPPPGVVALLYALFSGPVGRSST